jgi:peptidoglycan/LPS O-acetylase OafA/YrhL
MSQIEQGIPRKKERNYAIEFFRFVLAVNFAFLHVYAVFPMSLGATVTFFNGAEIIVVFAGFAGYFLMQNFKRQQAASSANGVSASRQAWIYLKVRIISLWPAYVFTVALGIVAVLLRQELPLAAWPMYFINCICEFLGIQITGLGVGISAVGPLWFLSGIFVCGYFVYFLLAKFDKTFSDFIAPAVVLLYWGSQYLRGAVPFVYESYAFGDFSLYAGLMHMFTMFCVGVIIWTPIDKLKNKEFSKGTTAIISILQLFLFAMVMFKSWISTDTPIAQFLDIGWSGTFIYCSLLVFLTILNKDPVTKFPLWASKIWKYPGKLALYIYMLHYPVISYVMLAMGIKTGADWDASPERITYLFVWVLVVTIALSVVTMLLNDRVLQPWLAKKPWYSKKQKELEAATVS